MSSFAQRLDAVGIQVPCWYGSANSFFWFLFFLSLSLSLSLEISNLPKEQPLPLDKHTRGHKWRSDDIV